MANSLDKARKEINEIDRKMAELFVKRMHAAEEIAEYKKERGLAILDSVREEEIIKRNSQLVSDELIREYYVEFLADTMKVSRAYQSRIIEGMKVAYAGVPGAFAHIAATKLYPSAEKVAYGDFSKAYHAVEIRECDVAVLPVENSYNVNDYFITKLHLSLDNRGYDINIGRGLIHSAGQLFKLDRKVLVLTDSGVPNEYAKAVLNQSMDGEILIIEEGEESKSLSSFGLILAKMAEMGMTRSDCLVAVGGGVVGDIGGFAAASYMRGIDFYNIPTTLLSQVDSSVGGKTAINHCGIKNIVGAFYQPKGVIIDPSLLSTLPSRHISNGLSEVVKMALSFDEKLFRLLEENEIDDETLDKAIIASIKTKMWVVEQDEREGGLRRVLNLGHTLGHGIEAENIGNLYHGECVAIGLIPVCSEKVKERLIPLLKKLDLPTKYDGDIEKALSFIKSDKKCQGEKISIIHVDTIGSYRIEKTDIDSFLNLVRKELK